MRPKPRNLERQVMKTKMFLATATAALILMDSNVSASEPLLSPKAKALADSLARVPGTTTDMSDRSVKSDSPKHIEFLASLSKVPGTPPDMIIRNGPAVPPRLLANEPWRLESFRVAPLK